MHKGFLSLAEPRSGKWAPSGQIASGQHAGPASKTQPEPNPFLKWVDLYELLTVVERNGLTHFDRLLLRALDFSFNTI